GKSLYLHLHLDGAAFGHRVRGAAAFVVVDPEDHFVGIAVLVATTDFNGRVVAIERFVVGIAVAVVKTGKRLGGVGQVEAPDTVEEFVAFGGPAEIVDDQVGAAIEPRGTEFVVSELQRIFRDVVANPAHWQRRGEVGLERARERYGWDAKIQSALRLYHQLLAK
ncbi:MAG TPA: hypothetical protein PL157_17610, partial [Acidobacteriota bacterium]|nr:hypothetical protein [Acidobacteriota bacterium]